MILNMIREGLGRLLNAWPVNRIVTVLTPTVFMPAAAYLAVEVPRLINKVLPGFAYHPNQTQITALMVTGAAGALAKAVMWLRGWQAHEARREKALEAEAHEPTTPLDGAPDVPPPGPSEPATAAAAAP